MLNLGNRKTKKHYGWRNGGRILPLLFVITLGLIACGGRGFRELGDAYYGSSSRGQSNLSAVETQAERNFLSLEDGLINERLRALAQADAKIVAQLRQELEKSLSRNKINRFASTPPIMDGSRVDDLTLADNGDGTYTLTWTYKNVGDYNQDGFVDIADITPIAEHFFEPTDSTNEWIDGNGDGIIDVADVGTLAENFFIECKGYSILTSDNPTTGYEQIASVPLSEATRDGALRFAKNVALPVGHWIKVAPFDRYGTTGIESKPINVPPSGDLPPIAHLTGTPRYGDAPLLVRFDASGSHDSDGSIVRYQWDWYGDGTWDFDSGNDPFATHEYSDEGSWQVVVLVTDDKGAQDFATLYINVRGKAVPGDWRMFGRNTFHTRRSPYVGAQSGILAWSIEVGWIAESSPAIAASGTVYIGTLGGADDVNNLYAILPDGGIKWKVLTELGGLIFSSPAVGSDGTIYVNTTGGYLFAINPNGTIKWNYQTGYAGAYSYSSPAIADDGTIYVGGWDHCLHAINPDGSRKWRYQTGDNVDSSPAIGADGTIYVGSDDSYLYAINPDGTLKWRYQTGGPLFSSPAIGADGTLYIGSYDGFVYAIKADGTLKWKYLTGDGNSYIHSSPAIGENGTIYIGCDDYYLYAINPDGTLKWRYKTLDAVHSSPAIGADGTIYFGSDDWSIYALNPDGTLKWKYQTNGRVRSSPAIAQDGTVIVGSEDFSLYAFSDGLFF